MDFDLQFQGSRFWPKIKAPPWPILGSGAATAGNHPHKPIPTKKLRLWTLKKVGNEILNRTQKKVTGPNVWPAGLRKGHFGTKSENAKKSHPKIKYQEGTYHHEIIFLVDPGIVESGWKRFGVVSLAGLKVVWLLKKRSDFSTLVEFWIFWTKIAITFYRGFLLQIPLNLEVLRLGEYRLQSLGTFGLVV